MKNYNENKEPSYLMYLDANHLYGWATSQKILANGYKWKTDMSIFDGEFIKNYDENKGYIFDVTIDYLKNLYDLHSDLPFLPERRKINKCNKLVICTCNLYDKKYVVHIRALKQALDHGLVFKKVRISNYI